MNLWDARREVSLLTALHIVGSAPPAPYNLGTAAVKLEMLRQMANEIKKRCFVRVLNLYAKLCKIFSLQIPVTWNSLVFYII